MVAAWMVRAGRDGEREDKALRDGLAIAGWRETGDLSDVTTVEELRAELQRVYPTRSKSVIANWTGQIWRFLRVMKEGDIVVLPLKTRPGKIAFGRIAGPYEFSPEDEIGFRHVRAVKWERPEVLRETIGPDLLSSMGSLLTVCGLKRHGAEYRLEHILKTGHDPGWAAVESGQDLFASREELFERALDESATQRPRLTIRQLLEMWDVHRRTDNNVRLVESDLGEAGVTTSPPFTEGWIDSVIEVVPVSVEASEAEDTPVDDELPGPTEMPSVSLRVGDLPSANKGVQSVAKTDSLELAISRMLLNNYSQLLVVNDAEFPTEAISWESIGKARLAKPDAGVADATVKARIVDADQELLGQTEEIYTRGYVFVRVGQAITGIVTAADLTEKFDQMARPVAFVEEIERRLRRRADEVFALEELKAASNRPNLIKSAADFTLGNYGRLLKPGEKFAKLGWALDHGLFSEHLDQVRTTRNEMMHFSPDPLDGKQLTLLEGFVNMLRVVDPRP